MGKVFIYCCSFLVWLLSLKVNILTSQCMNHLFHIIMTMGYNPRGTGWSSVGSCRYCRRISAASPWTSLGCMGTAFLATACTPFCKGISAPPPLLFTALGVSGPASLTYSHSPLPAVLAQSFLPYLNILSQRCYQCCWENQLQPAGRPSWTQLEFALPNMGATSGVFSQKPHLPHLTLPVLSKSSHINPIQYINPRVYFLPVFYFFLINLW